MYPMSINDDYLSVIDGCRVTLQIVASRWSLTIIIYDCNKIIAQATDFATKYFLFIVLIASLLKHLWDYDCKLQLYYFCICFASLSKSTVRFMSDNENICFS